MGLKDLFRSGVVCSVCGKTMKSENIYRTGNNEKCCEACYRKMHPPKKEISINERLRQARKSQEESAHSSDSFSMCKPPYIVSDVGKARYEFEHQILRDQFYLHPGQLIQYIMRENGLYQFASVIEQKTSWTNPYHAEDLHVDALRWNSDISLVSIELPEPEYTPLCYRIHMFFSDDYSKLRYYTIEISFDGSACLCGWDQNGNHLNYHRIESAAWPEGKKGLWKAIEANILIDLHAKINHLNPERDKEQE